MCLGILVSTSSGQKCLDSIHAVLLLLHILYEFCNILFQTVQNLGGLNWLIMPERTRNVLILCQLLGSSETMGPMVSISAFACDASNVTNELANEFTIFKSCAAADHGSSSSMLARKVQSLRPILH